MKTKTIFVPLLLIIFGLNAFDSELIAQTTASKETIILASLEIINETTYCGLVTIDSTGQPQIRTMNPFPVEKDFVIWFATARTSRKVREIKSNPNVSVYFSDHLVAKGYVNINGKATVIDDKELLVKMKREYWNGISDWQNRFVLIKIIPQSIEVINYKHGLNNDANTLKAPFIRL